MQRFNSAPCSNTAMAYFTTTDGCRLYYETHGFHRHQEPQRFDADHPAVVFLNGTTQTALQWRPQVLDLQPDFPIVCYDGRAQGKSEPGIRTLTLDLHVEDLLSLLSYLDIQKTHLVGLSHGARVALAFATRHLAITDRLILCGIGADPGYRTRLIVRSWNAVLTAGGLEALAWAALPVILGESFLKENEKILPKMVAALVARNRKESLLAHFTALLSYPPLTETASRLGRPCLVVSGSEDLLYTPGSAKRLAEIIEADYERFEKTGHNVPVEAAKRFNRLCRRFLTTTSMP